MTNYLLLKTIHIIAAIIFVGNAGAGWWWKHNAAANGKLVILKFAQQQIRTTDLYIMLPGSTLLIGSGMINLLSNMYSQYHATWVMIPFHLFILSGLIWLFGLRKIQKKQTELLAKVKGEKIPTEFFRLQRQWSFWSLISLVALFLSIIPMVYKFE